MTLQERVAKALFDAQGTIQCDWKDLKPGGETHAAYMEMAAEAIKEPTAPALPRHRQRDFHCTCSDTYIHQSWLHAVGCPEYAPQFINGG